MNKQDSSIGTRIAELRQEISMNQAQMSRELRRRGFPISQGGLSRIEVGDRPVRLSEAVAFANILRVTLDDLAGVVSGPEASERAGLLVALDLITEALRGKES